MMQEACGAVCMSSSRQVGLVTERVPSCKTTVWDSHMLAGLPVRVQLHSFPSVGCLDISKAGI